MREEADGEEADAEADGEEEEAPDAGVADDDAAADDETAPEAEAAVNDADAEDKEDPENRDAQQHEFITEDTANTPPAEFEYDKRPRRFSLALPGEAHTHPRRGVSCPVISTNKVCQRPPYPRRGAPCPVTTPLPYVRVAGDGDAWT